MERRILVVEDDPSIGSQLVSGLIREGFDATLAADGATARTAFSQSDYDLVLLDLGLPDHDGFSLLDAWRSRSSVPVIVLTARTELSARLRSFELGATDWLPKPFFLEEVVARIHTRLGHRPKHAAVRIALHDCEVDLDARMVRRGGDDLGLTAHEFNVLAVLVAHPGRAFTRSQLAERALPDGGERLDRTVDSHISRIRRKLGPEGAAQLRTVFGVGYRLDLEASG